MKVSELQGSQYTIALDLDGVFADFELGVSKLVRQGVITKDEARGLDSANDKFWTAMQRKATNFFLNLEKTRDADKLWSVVKHYDHFFLTARPRMEGKFKSVDAQKKQWVRNNISKQSKVIVCWRREKKNYAGPNVILIDDKRRNIDEWEAAGGIGILHRSAVNTIAELQNIVQQ